MRPLSNETPLCSKPEPATSERERSVALSAPRRFLLTLLVLRFFPFPIGWLPGTEWLSALAEKGRVALVQSVTLRLLGHPIDAQFNGSGDTTYEYASLGCDVAIATVLVLAWPFAAARWPAFAKLTRARRPYLRFALAATLLTYGFVKVLPLQFGTPSWSILSQTYGDSSPMRLLWTFMGASRPYTIASGAAEMLAGMLLLFEWTTGLGALVATGVMSNVVLLNFCYDVPVKIGSVTYLLTALVLLAPDAARAGRALWSSRPRIAWRDRRDKRTTVGRALVAAAVVYAGVGGQLKEFLGAKGDEQEPFAGFYEVTCYSDSSGAPGWRNVEVTAHFVQARFADGRGERYRLGPEDAPGTRSATRYDGDGTSAQAHLGWTREDDGSVVINVQEKGGSRRACLRAASRPDYLLMRRGFHWINEVPFNF